MAREASEPPEKNFSEIFRLRDVGHERCYRGGRAPGDTDWKILAADPDWSRTFIAPHHRRTVPPNLSRCGENQPFSVGGLALAKSDSGAGTPPTGPRACADFEPRPVRGPSLKLLMLGSALEHVAELALEEEKPTAVSKSMREVAGAGWSPKALDPIAQSARRIRTLKMPPVRQPVARSPAHRRRTPPRSGGWRSGGQKYRSHPVPSIEFFGTPGPAGP